MKFEELRLDRINTIVRYKPDILTWNASNRKDHIIGINISGVTYHDLGYKHLDLYPDYIYFFNQKDKYFADTKEVGYCYSIHFTTTSDIDTPSFCKKVNNTEEIIKLIEHIERLWLKREESELLMCSEFYGLCDLLHKLYNAPYKPKDVELIASKEYIDLHFREKGCISKAAERRNVTTRRYNDLFKLHFGITPNQYVISKKIDYASKLLELGYLSVTDIAELSGFSDVYYFSNQFKKHIGVSPSKFVNTKKEDK